MLEEANARLESGSKAGISAPARATLPLTFPERTPVGSMEAPLPVTLIFAALDVTEPETVVTETVYDPGAETRRDEELAPWISEPFLNHWNEADSAFAVVTLSVWDPPKVIVEEASGCVVMEGATSTVSFGMKLMTPEGLILNRPSRLPAAPILSPDPGSI